MDKPAAIIGINQTVRTRVDGSMVLHIEIEPRDAQDAFRLFGTPGTAVALAVITPEVVTEQEMQKWPTPEDTKGGPLAKLAGILCNEPVFWEFLTYEISAAFDAESAAKVVRATCHVQSRAELDHDLRAAKLFHERIRLPYVDWTHHHDR